MTRLTRVFRQRYCETLEAFLDEVFVPEWVDENAARIQPSIMEDPDIDYESWESEVEEMREYVEDRSDVVRSQLVTHCEPPYGVDRNFKLRFGQRAE